MNPHDWNRFFLNSCLHGNLQKVQELTTHKDYRHVMNIHVDNEQGLIWACNQGHLEIVKWLTRSDAMRKAQQQEGCWRGYSDIHADNERGFILACQQSNLEVVRWFLFDMDYEPLNQKFMIWNPQQDHDEALEWKSWLKQEGYQDVLSMVLDCENTRQAKKSIEWRNRMLGLR